MNAWKNKTNGANWSVSRDQQLQVCERKYFFQYLAGGRINAPDPWQRNLGMLKKLKNIRMWEGECLHWAIARYLGAVCNQQRLTPGQVVEELGDKVRREWQFSEQKRFRKQPMLIDKGGLALLEHEYDCLPAGTTEVSILENVVGAWKKFLDWANGPVGLIEKVRSADNVWIEPPMFGDNVPGFVLDDVQVIAKVDLAIEKSGAFLEIYDWKTGEAQPQNGSKIGQNELQVSVYQLWPHLSMKVPLEMISSFLVYFGGGTPEVCTYRLDEKRVPLILLTIRNSIAQAHRCESNILSGEMRLEDLDYASSLAFCRDCAFKGPCQESLIK